MQKWFIPQIVIDKSAKIAASGFIGKQPFDKKGYICLYSKNTMKNYYFKNPVQDLKRYAWIAERGSCPNYFKYVIDRWYKHCRLHLSYKFIDN
jgi:hypothetical protein